MSSQLRISLAAIGFVLMFSANVSVVKAEQKLSATEQTQIVNTVSTIFAAARTDDVAKSTR
jgi:hypothetical protein